MLLSAAPSLGRAGRWDQTIALLQAIQPAIADVLPLRYAVAELTLGQDLAQHTGHASAVAATPVAPWPGSPWSPWSPRGPGRPGRPGHPGPRSPRSPVPLVAPVAETSRWADQLGLTFVTGRLLELLSPGS